MNVEKWFKEFCDNIKFTDVELNNLRSRYKQITKRVNLDYRNSDSDTNNSLYVGSYGRGTATNLSDVDMLVILPYETYERFNNYNGNGQSALLQELKTILQKTYKTSHMRSDGQVVQISFTDGISFEIVPVFNNKDKISFTYPDTNSGGSWKKTNPRAEIEEIKNMDTLTNGNQKKLCKMIRYWKETNNVNIRGYLIDTLAYNFLKNWGNKDKGFLYYDLMSRDFFYFLACQNNSSYYFAPGSNNRVDIGASFSFKAKAAYSKAVDAIELEDKDPLKSKEKWREIYGTKFPK